jgi:hypothetical protein
VSFVIDKDALRIRLKHMYSLPNDWDGWGTEPISQGVYRICSRIVEFVDEDLDFIKFFVGVNSPGSAFIEISTGIKTFELTVTVDGTIFYDELLAKEEIGSGIFLLSKKKLDELLKR